MEFGATVEHLGDDAAAVLEPFCGCDTLKRYEYAKAIQARKVHR